jgi:septum formation protein
MLRAAGVQIAVDVPSVDEGSVLESFAAEGARARDAADALAELKSLQVSPRHAGKLVVGADQILSMDGRYFSKPASQHEARLQLRELRGRTHQLSSAAVVTLDGSAIWRAVGEANLTMRTFSDVFIDDYLEQAGPNVLTSVGAYQVESLGAQLFSRMDGDHFTILGLPLLPLLDMLRTQGVLKE